MPAPFQRLSIDQFAAVLKAFNFRRRVTALHMHHTWRPNHAMWKGHDSMVGMWRFHTQERGFSDIAQHLTIDPQGFVWTGRNWNVAPASAIGHNGTNAAGPFMFETVGDFDSGRDLLQGAQRKAVLDVICQVQARFGLPPDALMFHCQVANKSCPGNGISFDSFVAEVREHHHALAASPRKAPAARGRPVPPFPDSDLADYALVQRTLRLIEPETTARTAAAETPLEELDYDYAAESAMLGATQSRGVRSGDGDLLTPELIDALRPYVLNLRMGCFSINGLMTSSEADVDMIVHEHLQAAAAEAAVQNRPLRIVLFAHGGLVKESKGLAIAHKQVGWWRDNGVYPIYFIWETGLFETIKSLLEKARSPLQQRGLGDVVSDKLTDPLIEQLVRALQAERIWGAMKVSAQLASAEGGGARALLKALAAFIGSGANVELHAVGHSAGSIFHAHLIHAAQPLGLSFRSLQLLAPAVRVDTFRGFTEPLLGAVNGIDALTVFTMRRDFERDDDCAGIYRKSLLYLVSAGCEPELDAPLLGLEDSLRADPGLRALFGLGQPGAGSAEVVWSKSLLTEGRGATQALHHGDFDDDAPTMNSVLRRVLGLDDAAPLPRPYASSTARGGDPWRDTVDWPPELKPVTSGQALTPVSPARPNGSGQGKTNGGRRLALCIGIDNYPTAPLAGCRNDASLWQQTLQRLGFEANSLFDPTREQLVRAIERLVTSARAGDKLVLQYAGHGTQVDDLDGDEAGSPDDEALCPLDFADGALLIDDDLGVLIDRLDSGARLTLFMDCCHSGTISRFAGPGASATSDSERPRFVRSTPALREAHRRWRDVNGSPVPSGRKPEILFSACRSDQVAWERDGHGEFTLRATRVLQNGSGPLSARALHQRVLAAFGENPRQNPMLEPSDERIDQALF